MIEYMDWRVTPPKRVTSPTWGPPPTRKQALRRVRQCYEIFSMLSKAYALTSVILAGKRGSRRHSTTSLIRMSKWGKQVIKKSSKFIIFRWGEGVTPLFF